MEVSFREWIVNDSGKEPHHNFPELLLNKVEIDESSVGLALSGGGSRAHTLCAGYLRGLRDLGVLDKVKYISSVSGGSWASSIYAFVEDDDTLLGESTTPNALNLKQLKQKSPGRLAEVLTNFKGIKSILWKRLTSTSPSEIWQDVIGKHILGKFGLNQKIIAVDEEHRDSILQRHKHLTEGNIVIPPKGKPFLIVNAVLGGPKGHTTGWGHSLQITPLYTGTPFFRNNEAMKYYKLTKLNKLKNYYYWRIMKRGNSNFLLDLQRREELKKTHPDEELFVGGGFVETFAFGSKRGQKGKGVFKKAKQVFTLDDGIGASSAAFSTIFQNKSLLPYYNPHVNYFPLGRKAEEAYNKTLTVFDGGLIENTGIIPLLQRGLKRIICFINTSSPLNQDFTYQPDIFSNEAMVATNKKEAKYCADTQLLCLFGAVTRPTMAYNYTGNHVFVKEQLNDVMQALLENKEQGKGAITRQILTTVNNTYWHIKGGQEVEVVFVYNEQCGNFEEQLPKDTFKAIKKKKSRFDALRETVTRRRSFGNYPFYNTVFQNTRGLQLDKEEVNLLAAQAEFMMKHNEGEINKLFM